MIARRTYTQADFVQTNAALIMLIVFICVDFLLELQIDLFFNFYYILVFFAYCEN